VTGVSAVGLLVVLGGLLTIRRELAAQEA
jgi:hypothetical protein